MTSVAWSLLGACVSWVAVSAFLARQLEVTRLNLDAAMEELRARKAAQWPATTSAPEQATRPLCSGRCAACGEVSA